MQSTRTGYLEYQKEKDLSAYPFSSRATLRNAAGDVLIDNTFIDLVLYPIGIDNGAYLSQVEISADTVILRFGDDSEEIRALATFDVISPPSVVPIVDLFGMPAGMILSDPIRLNAFRSWSVGLHKFDPAGTELVASAVIPQPQVGVRAIADTAGNTAAGEVWLIGENGVILELDQTSESSYSITVNVTGDPLFKRNLCAPESQFNGVKYLQSLLVKYPGGSFTVTPNQYGMVGMSIDNSLASDTPLALLASTESLDLSIVGGRQRFTP